MKFRRKCLLVALLFAGAVSAIGPSDADDGPEHWQQILVIAKDAADGVLDGRATPPVDGREAIDPSVWSALDAGVPAPDRGDASDAATTTLSPNDAKTYAQVWRGAYICNQGWTGMALVL